MTIMPPPTMFSSTQVQRLRRALDHADVSFDPVEQLLRVPFSSPGYHTTLKGGTVHPIRENFIYAVALLDSGEEANRDRALTILDRLIDLQDTDPASKTYGIWSWFLEETLQEMSPPDWNWADFCGAQLLETALTHQHSYSFQERIRNAIIHAARSIERRNVGPAYTNIAIMGSFVTLAAAETYDLPDLRAYAMERFRRFHAYTMEQGGFTEYNSPTYTVVAIDELSRFQRHVRDPECRALAAEVYRRGWKEMADHFHAPTRQWSGPQSRAYRTLLPETVHGLLHRATGGRFACGDVEPDLAEHRLLHVCPPDLVDRFLFLPVRREVRKTFISAADGRPDIVGTTCLDPAFSLGSISAGDMWTQRRPLLAYWTTDGKPSSLRVRFLRNGFDFAGAYLLTAQHHGRVLAGINFAVDGFDTHLFFDPIQNGTIRAHDLRLRFEVEGAARDLLPSAPTELTDSWTLQDEGFSASLSVAAAEWDGASAYWERGSADEKSWLEVVLYSGEEKVIQLQHLSRTFCAFALHCSAGGDEMPAPRLASQDDRLRLTWDDLAVTCSARPDAITRLLQTFSSPSSKL